MTPANNERLRHLLTVAEKEKGHLQGTTQRLSTENIDKSWVEKLEEKPDLAERVDAFVARFGRLQDHLGDKLTPELLRQMLEVPSSAINNFIKENTSKKIKIFKKNDKRRIRIARAGRNMYHKYFNSSLVADFIIKKTFDVNYSKKFYWEK